MKYSKQAAKWLDQENASAILCSVSLDTKGWNDSDRKSHTPEVLVQVLDCDRRIQLHDFGDTRKAQLKKVQVLINELQWLESYIGASWDRYDKFWDHREEKKSVMRESVSDVMDL